jgi:hypothetical protein
VWIGVAGVTARIKCELLSEGVGAYINFLTLAANEAEYRAKLAGALDHYELQLFELLNVRPFSRSDGSSEEIQSIAEELEKARNPQHVRYSTFHTFPRLM